MEIKRHEQEKILSHAVEYGNTVYLAGIVAKDLTRGVKGQTEEILGEIDRLLAIAGSNKSRILSATIWLTDIRNRPAMNEAWSAWIDTRNLPARACVEAKLADPGMLVEIALVAAK
ncbi:MAG: RidA family protein [Betaproteobacteria bacterium]|nr:RidA family protein [Betaproteobacteria bacterium]